LPSLVLEEYYMNVLLVILGNLTAALGVGLCTALDFVSFPLESLCMVISKRAKASFRKNQTIRRHHSYYCLFNTFFAIWRFFLYT